MLPLLWKRMNSKLGSSALISLPVTVAFSHAIFLLPLALVLTARYFPLVCWIIFWRGVEGCELVFLYFSFHSENMSAD